MEYIPDIVTVKDEKIQSNVDSFFSDIISNLEKEAFSPCHTKNICIVF